MGYSALERMRELNFNDYGVENSVRIPDLPNASQSFGREALAFIRECCEGLKLDFTDERRIALIDSEGRSASPGTIPYNMERDLDRLCFEAAIGRFLESGSREDAFDIFYCYCEIFKPFGAGYDAASLLLEMLSEHETNASSLLMKHRDHYSHSVYVFLIGLALYRNHAALRNAYNEKYGLAEGPKAACHFLEFWGLTSLFHDIGYPFEIAHQQMKTYVCRLFSDEYTGDDFAPNISYLHMDKFVTSSLGDLNELYAQVITKRFGLRYLDRIGSKTDDLHQNLLDALRDRAVHRNAGKGEYRFMDHAYFSGLIVAKTYIERQGVSSIDAVPEAFLDSCTAIILHNSLFKFTIRGLLDTDEPLSLCDGQPLSYILMLCDELQCWDRATYGMSDRGAVYPFDFDMEFINGDMKWTYYFDEAFEAEVKQTKAYRVLLVGGHDSKDGAVHDGRSKFVDDIDKIVHLSDVLPDFDHDTSEPDRSDTIHVAMAPKVKKTGVYLSDSNYLNLYDFALALNGRYCGAKTEDEMKCRFEEDLSLEYKLSNIAQAKGFAKLLESIGCFYTDRPVEYAPVIEFEDSELEAISGGEHERWCKEKLALGWDYGKAHVKRLPNGKNDNAMRERTRLHHDLIPTAELDEEEFKKDSEPMKLLLEKIREFEGLTIYRM